MKKTFLLLLILTVFSVSASAQASKYISAIEQNVSLLASNSGPSPVVNLNTFYSVAAVKCNATSTAFCLIDHSYFVGTPLYVTPVIPPTITGNAAIFSPGFPVTDMTIYDMAMANQYVFFCGSFNSTISFVGYFNINDFLNGGSQLNITVYSLSASGTTLAPANLRKMVAYKDNTKFTVVAIGDEDPSMFYSKNMIVEITNATGVPLCSVANMPSGFSSGYSYKVFLDDILLTDNYVAVLGHELNAVSLGSCHPWVSVSPRSCVVSNICDPLVNPNFYLANNNEANNALVGTALENDTFAMAYVYYDEGLNISYTRLRLINIASMSSLINVRAQQFPIVEKEDPVDMIYLRGLQRLELMQPIYNPSNYVQLNPNANSNYSTSALNPNNLEFKSMTPIWHLTATRFISSRNATIYLQDRTASLPHSTPSCPSDAQIYVTNIGYFSFVKPTFKLYKGTINISTNTYSPSISTTLYNVQCFSYE